MKALCLSGHIRNLNYSLKKFDGDVFIVTWDKQDIDSNISTKVEELKTLKPKKILIENYELINNVHKFKYEKIKEQVQYNGTFHKNRQGYDSYSMWYLIKKVGELRKLYEIENNIKYDIVIRSRPDFEFINFTKKTKDNTLYFPINANYKGITDNYFHGNSNVMDTAFMVYDLMDLYLLKENCEWVNEKLFYHHLQKFGINIENLNIPIL